MSWARIDHQISAAAVADYGTPRGASRAAQRHAYLHLSRPPRCTVPNQDLLRYRLLRMPRRSTLRLPPLRLRLSGGAHPPLLAPARVDHATSARVEWRSKQRHDQFTVRRMRAVSDGSRTLYLRALSLFSRRTALRIMRCMALAAACEIDMAGERAGGVQQRNGEQNSAKNQHRLCKACDG